MSPWQWVLWVSGKKTNKRATDYQGQRINKRKRQTHDVLVCERQRRARGARRRSRRHFIGGSCTVRRRQRRVLIIFNGVNGIRTSSVVSYAAAIRIFKKRTEKQKLQNSIPRSLVIEQVVVRYPNTVLDHSYLVGNLTNSKIAETKALEPLKSRHFCISYFRICWFPQRDMSGPRLGALSNHRWSNDMRNRWESFCLAHHPSLPFSRSERRSSYAIRTTVHRLQIWI
jgi:hypothetical protein